MKVTKPTVDEALGYVDILLEMVGDDPGFPAAYAIVLAAEVRRQRRIIRQVQRIAERPTWTGVK